MTDSKPMFTGLLLKESLENERILDVIQVMKTETWNVESIADFQPEIWTAIYFEDDESQVDVIAEKLSWSLKSRGWYINISTDNNIYVIFPNKVIKYIKGDQQKRVEAIKYGQSLGIPDSQLDWGE
jgi:hypothetical protein